MKAIGSAPEDERDAEGDGEAVASERHRSDRTDQAAYAESGGHVTDRLSTRVEHLERRDDDQDVQAAADEPLSKDQRDDETKARHARNRAKPRREQLAVHLRQAPQG